MRPNNCRLIVLLLTFVVGVLLVYLYNGRVIPITGGSYVYYDEPDRNFCSQ